MAISNTQLLSDITSASGCTGTTFILNGSNLRDVQAYLTANARVAGDQPDERERNRFFTDLLVAAGTVRVPAKFVTELKTLLS